MGVPMKKIAVGTAVILAILSLAACAQTGKGTTSLEDTFLTLVADQAVAA